MKNNLILFFSIPMLIFACSCEGGSTFLNSSDLPAEPKKLIIEWHEGGGMLPEGEDIYLSTDSSYYSRWKDQTHQQLYFQTSEQELLEIYQVCRDSKFDRIRLIEEHEVYDRGGTSISLNIDGNYVRKNNSGMTFLHEDDYDEYDVVASKIYEFALRKIEDQKIKTTLHIGENLKEKNYLVYININGTTIYNSDTGDSLLNVRDTMLYKTSNEFALNLYDKDSVNSYNSPAFITYRILNKVISDTSHAVRFDIDEAGNAVIE